LFPNLNVTYYCPYGFGLRGYCPDPNITAWWRSIHKSHSQTS